MFKVGDKVLISPDSEYYGDGIANPSGVVGTVTDTRGIEEGGYYNVTVVWDTGPASFYREEDLIKEEPIMSGVYESIVQYDIAKESGNQAYGKLASEAVANDVFTKEHWQEYCRAGEDLYMESYHKDNPDAKKKDGSWKYRSYLPAAYNTAKSVIGNALEHNIPLSSGGEMKGKSALEKEIREAKTSSKDWADRYVLAHGCINRLEKHMEHLSDEEKDIVRERLTYL